MCHKYFLNGGICIKNIFIFVLCFIFTVSLCGCEKNDYKTQLENIAENLSRGNESDGQRQNLLNSYTAAVEIDPYTNTVNGIEKIKLKNDGDNSAYRLYFDVALNEVGSTGNLKILNVTLDNEDLEFEYEGDKLCVRLEEPIKTDNFVELAFNFEASLPEDFNVNKIGGVWRGEFLPAFAGFEADTDYEQYFANYDFSVSVPKGYTVIGSGSSVTEESDGRSVFRFDRKMVRNFAFAFGKNYNKKTVALKNGIDVNLYYFSDGEDYEQVVEKAAECIEFLCNKIGSYPYDELNIVESSFNSLECADYSQIIFVNSDCFKDNDFDKDFCYNISKQWFYHVLGINEKLNPQLCEGLSLYVRDLMSYSESDLDEEMSFLREKLKEEAVWSEDYYYAQGVKAELMFYSLNKKIGEFKFYMFLKLFYSRYMFRGANMEDMISAAEDIWGESLDDFFEQWIESDFLPEI